MNANQVFLVTDQSAGELRNTVIKGAADHEAAREMFRQATDGAEAISIVSLAELEQTASVVRRAAESGDAQYMGMHIMQGN